MDKNANIIYDLELNDFLKIIDSMYDEVLVYDNNYNIVYINQASKRHYACTPNEMIGKSFFDYIDKSYWGPSILPIIYKEKKPYAIKQHTFLGTELLTIAVPILDENGAIKYVVMNVRDNVDAVELYNPQYIYIDENLDDKAIPIEKSKAMQNVMKLVRKVSQVDTTSLLTGESGTGKTMIANYMHSISPRKNNSFIHINCASIPNELFESELFGYEKGAFTGASASGKKGLLQSAHKGTVFLDEVSELSPSAQAKLLLVLQDKEFMPIGSSKAIKADFKVIAATNKNLKNMVAIGTFREDLYYRLNVIEIYIPPLRKRKEDIPYLIDYFFENICKRYKLKRKLSEGVITVLKEYEWKGNIRELKHIIERLIVTTDRELIDIEDLPKNIFGIVDSDEETIDIKGSSYKEKMEEYESLIINEAYKNYGSSRKVAKHLCISQTKANNLIRKYVREG